jgi:hypothetical protein
VLAFVALKALKAYIAFQEGPHLKVQVPLFYSGRHKNRESRIGCMTTQSRDRPKNGRKSGTKYNYGLAPNT